MMWLLDMFSKATLGNYGLAIILLVVLVRLGLHPLTKKGQVSMMAMQKLQPQMEAAREKYKDNKAKLNEEMMKIYKSAGASPFLGCLPMVLQMPIWIALWTGLQAAVELRHAGLLPFWITDLAAPDALIDFGRTLVNLPLVGPLRSFNLLPILLAVGMVLNQKFTPSTPTSTQQQATQKQMMYFMNVFFLLIFYNAPSGLTMYIMASTFAGVFEQYVIRKHIRERQAAEAAAETKVAIPGKHFRGQKPKKPRGPFRIIR
jgi:YidC/Oxa1 family membrane protein insertase